MGRLYRPDFRDRRRRLIKEQNGKERLRHRGAGLGSKAARHRRGSARSAPGRASSRPTRWNTRTASPAGSIRTRAFPTWMPTASTRLFFIPASACSPAPSRSAARRRACRAYNRWLADYCKPYPDRLFGVAMLPLQSVDLAIAEMRFARKDLGHEGRLHPAEPI